ncbi:MAG: MBL fold metallo-hydrolase [Sulfurimonas sp.]|nr:MBL fold metallo-hydrolase [Sulfurimonas sp.]
MKKITLLITMAMLFSLSLNAWTLGKLGDFKFEKVNANVWVMHGPVMMPNKENGGFMNNPALIESENGLIIVDPGGNYNVGKEILKEVEKVSKKPVIAIFNTHKHGDHWFANKNFQEKYPDVKIYALAYMIEKVKESSADLWYGILDRLTGNLAGTNNPFAFPNTGVDHKETVVVDGQTFIMRHPNRGHTDTDLLIEHVNSKTLFLGDNLMKGRFGAFDESSSIHANIEILENVINKKDGYGDYKLYVPGHGPSGALHETLDPFLKYMKIVVQGAEKAYEEGMESYEIKPEVMENLKDFHSWDDIEGQMGKHLMKAYSEVEARDM